MVTVDHGYRHFTDGGIEYIGRRCRLKTQVLNSYYKEECLHILYLIQLHKTDYAQSYEMYK